MKSIRLIFLYFLLVFPSNAIAQNIKILSWNIQDLGKTKNDVELAFMAKVMNEFDIVAIQEVVAIDPAGARALARITDNLNRLGSKWDYKVSDPTNSAGKRKERYAYIWKTSAVTMIGRPWLDKNLSSVVCREPYLARFSMEGKNILCANYHSIPHADKPQYENGLVIANLPVLYPDDHLLIAGDWNINSDKDFWLSIYEKGLGLLPMNQKSTLRRACTSNNKYTYKNHAIDFFIFEKNEIAVSESGVLDYIQDCNHLLESRKISDHLPAWIEIEIGK